jgi:DNA-binding NarL/FixJ family response regulator
VPRQLAPTDRRERAIAFLVQRGATRREIEVYQLTREGLKASAIAFQLKTSDRRVEHLREQLRVRLGAHNFPQLQLTIENALDAAEWERPI